MNWFYRGCKNTLNASKHICPPPPRFPPSWFFPTLCRHILILLLRAVDLFSRPLFFLLQNEVPFQVFDFKKIKEEKKKKTFSTQQKFTYLLPFYRLTKKKQTRLYNVLSRHSLLNMDFSMQGACCNTIVLREFSYPGLQVCSFLGMPVWWWLFFCLLFFFLLLLYSLL